MLFCQQLTDTLKYHLVIAEPSFTVKMIDNMHQTGLGGDHSILVYVTFMLVVYEICHVVGRCKGKKR